MDLVGEAITAMRTGLPRAARALLLPPWGLRFHPAGAAGVHVILKGSAWLLPPSGDPILMSAGDVALVRRGQPHGLADDPGTPLYDVGADTSSAADHWPADGSALDERTPGTVLIGGTYYLSGARPHPLFESLPDVVHLPARIGAASTVRTVIELLGAEMDRERPGLTAALPALLDLLLLYTMRTWFEDSDTVAGWAQALRDPSVSAALRAMQDRPSEPWTVASLASESGLSRAAFARRFTGLTGQPPLTYLTWWRMTLAARLLQTTDATVDTVAGRVGYRSEYAFSKAFKRELGSPPARYRREQRAAAESEAPAATATPAEIRVRTATDACRQ